MKTKLIALALTLIMLFVISAVPTFAAEDFVLNAEFEFSNDGEFILVSGTTSAKYNQVITVVLYDPAFSNGLEDLREENGQLSTDPASKKPLTDVNKILRMGETRASKTGEYSICFPLDGIENGQYIIVKASGGGKKSVSASTLVQYQTQNYVSGTVLPAFETATVSELGALFVSNQLLLGIDLGDDYQANKDMIHQMFVSVRENDYEVSSATGKKFNSLEDIQNVFRMVNALRTLPSTTLTSSDISHFVNSYKSLMDYDFSTDNEHYTLVKNEAYVIAANVLNEARPQCISDIETAIAQGVAVAMINTKDATTIAPVINKYALLLGLDKTDYSIYCETYGAYEVNKAFVERDFKHPSEVLTALAARIKVLADAADDDKNSGGGNSGGGGGSSSSDSFGSVQVVPDAAITSDKEKDEQSGNYFTDITNRHWAYQAIRELSSRGIITGYPNGSFSPDAPVTREQLVKMIILTFGLNSQSTTTAFSDIASNRWSASYIKTASDKGIVSGMPDGSFMPEAAVTRQDAAVMIARACKADGRGFAERKQLSDSAEISDYATESVEELVAAGIISGFEDGSYRPLEKLTRAQAAQLLYGLLKK